MYQLKYKAIALAAEAKAFKQHERHAADRHAKWQARAALGRLKAQQRGELGQGQDPKTVTSVEQQGVYLHRLNRVRPEARNALLAYGFLKGKSYQEIENFSWTQPNWDRVLKLAIRYGDLDEQVVAQRFAEWISEALGGVKQAKFIESIVPGTIKTMVDSDTGFNNCEWVKMQLARDSRPAPRVRVKVPYVRK